MTKITHVSWAMFGLLPHPIRDSAPVVASPSRFDFILDAQPGCCTLPGTHPDDRGNIAEPSRVDWEVHSRDLVVRANAVCVLPSNFGGAVSVSCTPAGGAPETVQFQWRSVPRVSGQASTEPSCGRGMDVVPWACTTTWITCPPSRDR
jgi:hypothetical protein